MDDKERVAQSFILTFYTDVQSIKTHFSVYLSYLLQFENMYPETKSSSIVSMEDVSEEHKNLVLNSNNELRYYIQNSYFDFISITQSKTGIKCEQKLKDKIIELYGVMKKELFINRDIVEEYILKINEFMVSDIMKQLLDQSQNFINNVYDDDRTSSE